MGHYIQTYFTGRYRVLGWTVGSLLYLFDITDIFKDILD